MTRHLRSCFLLFLAAPALCASAAAQTLDSVEFFEKKIRPVLAENCQVCHSAQLKTAGLDLSSAEGFVRGGESGPLVSRDEPAMSRLLQVIGYEEKLKMPPGGKLDDEPIADFKTWVEMGAPWPGAEQVAAVSQDNDSGPGFSKEQKNFWAFQPLDDPEPPRVANEAWARSPIDRFILARIEAAGLEPAPAADKTTLLRRATYDLTGLPPTEKEIADFLADDSPKAFETVVERLLGSARYGERWGRHWLDVARYADSAGNDEDVRYPYAWRYRDYVIQALNDDMPYDQFVREQVAGDLLPAADGGEINRRGIVATGFLALGPKAVAQQDKMKMRYDVYDEQLDVVSKAVLGLTITCARCHDHKFDPILQRDYYSMIGIFSSTRSFSNAESHVSSLLFKPLVPRSVYDEHLLHRDRIFSKKLEIEDVLIEGLDRYNEGYYRRVKDYMLGARRVNAEGAAVGATAAQSDLDPKVLDRWAAFLQPGEEPREYLSAWREASAEDAEPIAADYQQRFDEQTAAWRELIDRWRAIYRKMLKERNMTPPPKPEFRAERDAFYHAVNFKQDGPFFLADETREAVLSEASRQTLARLRGELKQLADNAPPDPPLACAVEDNPEPADQRIFLRGDHHNPGAQVARGFPLILGGGTVSENEPGSGRLALARWLTRPDHPLTSRVMANRIWQWRFGRGIVSTPSNFGSAGAAPTHPALLDYLARLFVRNGWSLKRMHREIMLSSAYRMSSEVSAEQYAADPANDLLSRFNRRRLDVEEIHDGMLAMDGTLDLTVGGTLQEGFGTDRENSSKRLSVNPDQIDRRVVYIPLRRANLPTLLNLFDFGDATTTQGKRAATNVAPQALFLMNSEFVARRAAHLAVDLLDDDSTASDKIERAYLIILNRPPEADEVDAGLTYIDNVRKKFSEASSDQDAWGSFCRILLASNDFIYVD